MVINRSKKSMLEGKEVKMRILLIRHGEPDYSTDSLTEKGRREAELLAQRLSRENIAKIYSSPLGRARLTAEPTARDLGLDVEILPFMREFNKKLVKLPYDEEHQVCWDLLPGYTNELDGLYSPSEWQNVPHIKDSEVYNEYLSVCREFDELLARHGYLRNGTNYKVIYPNHDTIAIFCHFGVMAVVLSHLMNCSPYSVWQHSCALTSSVTTIYTEERREGIALMRMCGFSDISHLYAGGEKPSFMARFSECYTDGDRND